MLSSDIQTLLDALPKSEKGPAAQDGLKRVARSLLETPKQAVDIAEVIGGLDIPKTRDHRLVSLLMATLDEARMARENGKLAGGRFIDFLTDGIGELKEQEAFTPTGRLLLASCWTRAGLPAPDALADDFSIPDGFEAELDLSEAPEFDQLIDKVLEEVSGGEAGNISLLHAGFSDLLATFPAPLRPAIIRSVVARPKTIMAELGCALLLDGRAEVRRGALDGLENRLAGNTLPADIVGQLTILRSWVPDEETRAGIDALVRHSLRLGLDPAASKIVPKVHRALSSLIDGTGAQSLSIIIQAGGARYVAVVLVKQGFGIKDAYLIPCTSASEQRRLIDLMTGEVETRDVPVSYIEEAIAIGVSDGLQAGHPPAPGLVGVVRKLGWSDLRPQTASIRDIIARADPAGQIEAMSAQARGRLINASSDWGSYFPMISDSWYEDSDSFTSVIETASTPSALKRRLWLTLDARRSHWAHVIARMAFLLHATDDPLALQFVSVAKALDEGRDLKKTPVMEMICNLSVTVWLHETRRRSAPADMRDKAPSGTGSRPDPKARNRPGGSPEKRGELGKLLKQAGLTEWWIDGYMMGVCTAPEFVPPPSWVQILFNIIGPHIKSDKVAQRILDLLMQRYNGTFEKLRVPVGAVLVPEEVNLASIWADGYLTAWEGNRDHWPEASLSSADARARQLLEDAASFEADFVSFKKTIPNWLRQRFSAQV